MAGGLRGGEPGGGCGTGPPRRGDKTAGGNPGGLGEAGRVFGDACCAATGAAAEDCGCAAGADADVGRGEGLGVGVRFAGAGAGLLAGSWGVKVCRFAGAGGPVGVAVELAGLAGGLTAVAGTAGVAGAVGGEPPSPPSKGGSV